MARKKIQAKGTAKASKPGAFNKGVNPIGLREKIGYSFLAVSIGLLGVSSLFPYVKDSSDPETQRLYGSIAVFWCVMVYGIANNLIWSNRETAPVPSDAVGAPADPTAVDDLASSKPPATRRRRA